MLSTEERQRDNRSYKDSAMTSVVGGTIDGRLSNLSKGSISGGNHRQSLNSAGDREDQASVTGYEQQRLTTP